MGRRKVKPDLTADNIGKNPFTERLIIPITKKSTRVLNKFDVIDEREYDLELTPYTKIFEVPKKSEDRIDIMDLPVRCKELYLWFVHAIKSGQDIIWIDRGVYMRKMKMKSINTFKDAVNGLCDNMYIYKHHLYPDTFWINPYFFFKGSRINKYPNNVVVTKQLKEK